MFASKPAGPTCPLLKSACLRDACTFWMHLRGKHPQSGADVDEADCVIRWLPVLLMENARETRQCAAAVESHRNENLSAVGAIANLLEAVNVPRTVKTRYLYQGRGRPRTFPLPNDD